ncbi:hypothetical protein L915_12802, partial [Phytophthora nicotianae]
MQGLTESTVFLWFVTSNDMDIDTLKSTGLTSDLAVGHQIAARGVRQATPDQ